MGPFSYGVGFGAYHPYHFGFAAPAIVAAPAAAEEEEAEPKVAAVPALTYAGLPLAGLPYAGLPYTAATLPKLELPAGAISYSLGGVPFIVPAVAAQEEAEEAAVEVEEE